MMQIPNITSLVLILLNGVVFAQSTPSEEWFNQAAKQYIKEDKGAALRTLDQALREHPGDARLLSLAEELLKEQQQDQQQPRPQDQQQKDGGEDQPQQGNDGQDQQGPPKEDGGDRNEPRDTQGEKPAPGRIAPQDAKRILDALDRQEKDTQEKVRARQRPTQRTPTDKDW